MGTGDASLGPEVRAATGSSSRRLVCVSGLGGVSEEWDAVAPVLARYGEVRTMELSLSARAGGGGPFVAPVAALDRALGDGAEPPVLIGHSMGAVASLMLAASEPDRLAGLVLTAPFVPLARNGRSSLVTAADYARHRLLFLADSAARRRQRSGLVDLNFATRAGGLAALAWYGLRPAAIPASGHFPHRDAPDEWLACVERFLQQLVPASLEP